VTPGVELNGWVVDGLGLGGRGPFACRRAVAWAPLFPRPRASKMKKPDVERRASVLARRRFSQAASSRAPTGLYSGRTCSF
jgi:hypothetical protein